MADESIPTATEPSATDPAASAVAPSALKGWAALQYGVNVLLPRDLSRANTVRQAALRVLRNG